MERAKYAANVLASTSANMIFGWSETDYWEGAENADSSTNDRHKHTFLADDTILAALQEKLKEDDKLKNLSDEQLVKICRQLDFFYKEEKFGKEEMLSLALSLVDQSLWYRDIMMYKTASTTDARLSQQKVPKVRFGKTGLNISILTCGGMRLQNTWFSDSIPLLRPNRKQILASSPQKNIKDCVRSCLALGINHFETARMYGTSEYQMVEALHELMQEGEIKREDFIFQTKILPGRGPAFLKLFNATWSNVGQKLGYIDLLGVHAISDINEAFEESLAICADLKREGKIRHIGFSTHGTSEQIMNLINTEKFEYINLHEHYFGSYHGSGTPDTVGGEGNLACVKRALELDMGVFQISPIDKGGKLFRPSKDCASLIGKDLTPIEFALLYGWKKIGFHTASIGIARPSDLDEVLAASRKMALEEQGEINVDHLLQVAMDNLEMRANERLGKEWVEKGLLNLPSPFDESTDGIAVGHILWLHNLLVSYGMYEYCRDRYLNLVEASWNKKKTFQENADAMSRVNIGRAYDESIDLTKALENHFDPSLALERIKQTHEWLSSKEEMTDEELKAQNWSKGYNLTVWTEAPGAIDSTLAQKLATQILTGGRMGINGFGPGKSFRLEASEIRSALSK